MDQFEFRFDATVAPQRDGSFVVRPGKLVVRDVLRVGEVAKRLLVTPQHVLDLIEEGKLEAVNVGGGERKHWRIRVDALEVFMRNRSSLGKQI